MVLPDNVDQVGIFVVFFVFLSLLLGVGVTFFQSLIPEKYPFFREMPYVVVIFAIGFFIGIWASTLGDIYSQDDAVFKVTAVWENFPPELFIYMFLPVLIYEEVTNLNLHHFKTTVGQGLVLAFPAAIAGTFILAAIINANGIPFPVNWGSNAVYLFASILCATDSVSVVSLLSKMELFRSQKLKYIIVNESLFNDATALLLYAVFLSSEISDEYESTITFNDAIFYFLRVVFFSPALGLAFGIGTVMFMYLIGNPHNEDFVVLRSIVTVSSAYISFIVGQYLIGISGILVNVFNGLVFMYRMPAFFKHYESVHYVWHTLGWISNTMIFYVAGLVFGYRTIGYCSWQAVANIIIIYVLLFVVRAMVLVFFYPLLNWLGKGVTTAEMVFMVFSGLRGAVSVALALNVALLTEGNYMNSLTVEQASTIFLYAGGVSGLSLVLNASMADYVLRYLNLSEKQEELPYESQLMRNSYKRQLMEASVKGWLEIPPSHRMIVRTKCRFFNDLDGYITKHGLDPSVAPAVSVGASKDVSSKTPGGANLRKTGSYTPFSPPVSEASPLMQSAESISKLTFNAPDNKTDLATKDPVSSPKPVSAIGPGGLQAFGRQNSARQINQAFTQPIETISELPTLADLTNATSIDLDLSPDELKILIQLNLDHIEGEGEADDATVVNDSADVSNLEMESEAAIGALNTLDEDSDDDKKDTNTNLLSEANVQKHMMQQNSPNRLKDRVFTPRMSRQSSLRPKESGHTDPNEDFQIMNSYIEPDQHILMRSNSIMQPAFSRQSSLMPQSPRVPLSAGKASSGKGFFNAVKAVMNNNLRSVEAAGSSSKDAASSSKALLRPLLDPSDSLRVKSPYAGNDIVGDAAVSPQLSTVDEAVERESDDNNFEQPVNDSVTTYVRSAFLECVRSYYLDKIRRGYLDRYSDVVIYLMNSVDAGLETISTKPLDDWAYLDRVLSPQTKLPFIQSVLDHKRVKPFYEWLKRKSSFALKLDKQCREDFINTLNYYVYAHQYAQIKIPSSFDLSRDTVTPEVALVVAESQYLVEQAKSRLRGTLVDPRALQYRYTREKLLTILTNCENMLFDLQNENIIMKSDFNYFLNLINEDRAAVDRFATIIRKALEMARQRQLGVFKEENIY